jgi:hypothetical protein
MHHPCVFLCSFAFFLVCFLCSPKAHKSRRGAGEAPAAKLKPSTQTPARCWGTLSCSLWVHPEVQRAHAAAFDGAVARLRYGSVAVNSTSLMGFAVTKLGWGAAPGAHSLQASRPPRAPPISPARQKVFAQRAWSGRGPPVRAGLGLETSAARAAKCFDAGLAVTEISVAGGLDGLIPSSTD